MRVWFFREKNQEHVKQTRRSMRENFYFSSKLWGCASNHVHQKEDVFHGELPGICFYNATSWKMIRLEQSKREETEWQCLHPGFPSLSLAECVLPAWIKHLWCVGALGCGVPWHPAQTGTEVHGTAGAESSGLYPAGVRALPAESIPPDTGSLGNEKYKYYHFK